MRIKKVERVPLKSVMTGRRDVYLAIDSERNYQERLFTTEKKQPDGSYSYHMATDRSLDEFILYIQQYAAEAAFLTTHGNEVEALNFVRKIAGLCTGCMERHGAPLRPVPFTEES
jgi:hypothetical protein